MICCVVRDISYPALKIGKYFKSYAYLLASINYQTKKKDMCFPFKKLEIEYFWLYLDCDLHEMKNNPIFSARYDISRIKY